MLQFKYSINTTQWIINPIVFVLLFLWGWKGTVCALTTIRLDNQVKDDTYTLDVIESSFKSYTIRVNIHKIHDSIVIHNNVPYHYLQLEEESFSNDIGKPQLPIITQLINIPNGASYTATISETRWTALKIGKILPSQRDYLEKHMQSSFDIDTTVYYSQNYFQPLLSSDERIEWRHNKSVNLTICPFKYYPSKNTLEVLTEFELQINYKYTSLPAKKESLFCSNDILHLYDNIKEENANFSCATRLLENTDSIYDYLIIVGDIPGILESEALNRFLTWKACKGYKTRIVSTNTIGTTPALIKDYIIQEHGKGVNYVLFIGDHNKIPVYQDSLYVDISDAKIEFKGDYWYACLGGDSDYIADVAIGRFPSNNLTYIANMIDKTIKYEKSYNESAQKVLLIAHKEHAPSSFQWDCENIIGRQRYYRDSIDFIRAYGASVDSGGMNATNREVFERINNGVNIVTYRGHGWFNLWGPWWNALNEHFYAEYIDSLNENTNAVYFSISCETGDITNTPCMLKKFMCSEHGAASFMGYMTDSYHSANQKFARSLFLSLLRDGVYTFGDLIVSAITKNLMNNYSSSIAYNAYSLLCGGDPTLDIWTQKPYKFNDIEITMQSDSIYVNSNNTNDFQMAVISEEGELLYKCMADGQTCKTTCPTGNFFISLYKHNYLPQIIYLNTNSSYIQNRNIIVNEYYTGSPLNIGYDIDNNAPFGNVIVKNGAKLNIRCGNGGVYIKNGFEIENGAELNIE